MALLLMHTDEFITPARRVRAQPRMLGEFAEGFRFLFHTPAAVVVLITLGVIGCLGYNFSILMPLFAQDVFRIGAEGFGVLMSAVGLGSLIAAVAFASRARSSQRNVLLTAGSFSLLLLVVALAPAVGIAVGALIVAGFMSQYFGSSSNTLMQFMAPDYLRGRVMGVYMLLFAGTKPIGGLVTGYLAGALGARTTMGIEAGACAIAVVCSIAYARATRDRPPSALRVAAPDQRLAAQPVQLQSRQGPV